MQRKQPILENGVELWQCSTCKQYFSKEGFYLDKRKWNGIKSQCRSCHIKGSIRTRDKENANRIRRESMRRMRKKQPEKYREREREASKKREKDIRYYARKCLNNAVARGIIIKPEKCSKCGETKKLTAHHADYTKPLEVEWLFYECHAKR